MTDPARPIQTRATRTALAERPHDTARTRTATTGTTTLHRGTAGIAVSVIVPEDIGLSPPGPGRVKVGRDRERSRHREQEFAARCKRHADKPTHWGDGEAPISRFAFPSASFATTLTGNARAICVFSGEAEERSCRKLVRHGVTPDRRWHLRGQVPDRGRSCHGDARVKDDGLPARTRRRPPGRSGGTFFPRPRGRGQRVPAGVVLPGGPSSIQTLPEAGS